MPSTYRLGVDIGGTFTDLVLVDETTGAARVGKFLTTPKDPAQGVEAGLARLLDEARVRAPAVRTLIHGTTLATNAIVERKGARTGLIATRGFSDALVERERVAGVVTATGERIESRCVVNAAGLWAGVVAALAGVTLPIVVGRHPVFIVKRGPAFGSAHSVYLDLAGGTYVRPETGDLTLTGSLTEDETRHPMDPDLLGSEIGFEEAASALEKTSRALPLLADCQYKQGYAGAFDITPDWMPILDESPVRGFYIAAGMSGHGFKLAPAVGELMAELITEGRTGFNRDPFRFDRFAAGRSPGSFVSSYLAP